MTETRRARDLAKRAGRVAARPVTSRLDHLRKWLHPDATAGEGAAVTALSILAELAPDQGPKGAGEALRLRLDHGLLHAEAVTKIVMETVNRQIGELRSTTRLAQSMVEQAMTTTPVATTDGDGRADQAPDSAAIAARFIHPVPSFDLLYRAFEDRHRGDQKAITERQGHDYLDLLRHLPNPELPVADLGCGRGELVRLLDGEGLIAVGVDSNPGQVVDCEGSLFIKDDLFRWLDAQAAGSHRAVVSTHVVEHLPLELQIRLVFESRRILAEGGILLLETPNSLSLTIAANQLLGRPHP